MKLVNLTKDVIRLYDTQGDVVEIAPDPRHIGVVAVGEHHKVEDDDGHVFSLNVRFVKEIKGMPDPDEKAIYIVPVEVAMVLQSDRRDVVFPSEEAHVADAEGRRRRVTHLRRVLSRLT